ncbi:MAG TPA: discoidin domain-containing protein [Anaerolineales bacterium]|nr:discoidin domain-containing protein [Anaerolineales bacterium]
MKPTSSPNDHEIIEILERLKSLKDEYPPELLAARRAAFMSQVEQQRAVDAKRAESSEDRKVIKILKDLGAIKAEYPPELLATRRATFLSQVEVQREASQDQRIIEALESLKPARAEYPPQLLAARRAAFMAEVAERGQENVEETLVEQDQQVIKLLASLKTTGAGYPSKLLANRRAAFIRQVRGWGSISLLDVLHSAIQRRLSYFTSIPLAPMMKAMRASLVVISVLVAAFITTLVGNRALVTQLLNASPTKVEVSRPNPVTATSAQELQTTICKPGYSPPLCLAKKFDTSQDLTYQGNGARPAVAKDTLPGHSGIHQPEYVNDGHYGNGSSWISNSAYSWIKIDLGKVTAINTVEFGRDRLGNLSDRKPGQFTIAVALSDNVYADGNSSNDNIEYTLVYDSERAGLTGNASAVETVTAHFNSVTARYVKITFANPGIAIDEVEVFMIQPAFVQSGNQTERPNNRPPRATSTPVPTNTLRPTNTWTPIPTSTPTDVPTDTPVPPTNTPEPTDTPTDVPTSTPPPTNTATDVPTNTAPPPTDPFTLAPTDTPMPEPTH